jgi:hypothetical protein
MPGYDQTGPLGRGSMTGRRMGRCANEGRKVKEDEIMNESLQENVQNGRFFGRGFGRMNRSDFGFGRGFSRGCRRGYRGRMGQLS